LTRNIVKAYLIPIPQITCLPHSIYTQFKVMQWCTFARSISSDFLYASSCSCNIRSRASLSSCKQHI